MMSFSYIKLYLTAFHFTINIFYYIFQLTSCRSKPQEPSGEIWNGPPNTKGRKRPKKNAGLIRSVGGRVNKQGNLLSRLIQGDHKMSWSQHPPARISKVYTEALTQPSHIPFRWSQQPRHYLNAVPLGRAPWSKRTASKAHIPRSTVSYPFNDPL